MAHVTDPFVQVGYVSDLGDTFAIKMHASVATAMGYTPLTAPTQKWPYKHKMCRHIRAKNQASPFNEISVVALTQAQAEYMQASAQVITWIDSDSYDCIGAIGERRDLNNH